MNKVLKIIALIAIAGGLAFAGYSLFKKPHKDETEIIKADKNKDGKKAKSKEAALPVKALKIQRGDLPLRLNISATADVWEKAVVKAEVAGTVEKIRCTIGDWVRNEQLLVKLDDVEKQLDVQQREAEKLKSYSEYLVKENTDVVEDEPLTDQKKAELKVLQAKYMQALKDIERGKISQKKFEVISDSYQKSMIFSGNLREEVRKAQEGLTGAIISLKRAQLDLKRASVRSPFQGKVADLKISVGEKVSLGQELFKVVNLKSLYLKGFALESEISKLKEGTRVRIRFDSFPKEVVYGELQSISPEIDATKKTINIFVKVDNSKNQFLPGMHAEIDIEHEVISNVMKVPQSAVIPRQGRYLVFIVRDLKGTIGTAFWEYVEIGNQNDEEIEIKSDAIKEGDLVLVDGHYTLAHQSRVKIQK
jgi:RND family efflux transporter MFP subunit